MPWQPSDAGKHIKGLSDNQSKAWAKIANKVRDKCLAGGGTADTCDARAIKFANSAVKNVKEADMSLEQMSGRLDKIEEALDELAEATWDVAYQNDLLDTAFLYIAPGGEKDDGGKTIPRSLRYFPVYDSSGKIDLPHLRNALARIPQAKIDQAAKDKAINKAKALAKKNLPGYQESDKNSMLTDALKERMAITAEVSIVEVADSHLIYEAYGNCFKLDYSVDDKGKVTVGEPLEVVAKTVYEPVTESIGGDIIPLAEKAIGKDGTTQIRIIKPGWGASCYYSKDVLARDAAIYAPGTKMYWDHPTESEDRERPERSLRDLAAELVSPGAYNENGPAGPGVYAQAKVFGPYREAIEELAPHIGLSHRALGMVVQGEAEGKKGPVLENIVAAQSVDFVTTPGAGGQVVQLFEAARARANGNQESEEETKNREEAKRMEEAKIEELTEANKNLEEENARLREVKILREAKDIAAGKVSESDLPEITKQRLIDVVSRSPVVKEGELDREAYEKAIDEAIKAEVEYVAKLTESGKVKGLGDGAEDHGSLKEAFKVGFLREGKSEEEAERMAEIAVRGR